jgi:hypothetical protein
MLPALISIPGSPWDVLPPGIHESTLKEVELVFAYNQRRRVLMSGLISAAEQLAGAGCRRLFLDGSFVSAKPKPNDFDACWSAEGVNLGLLSPVFKDFTNGRAAQKAQFGGEFFPATMTVAESGGAFVEFFQTDRFTGARKGLIALSLSNESLVIQRTL